MVPLSDLFTVCSFASAPSWMCVCVCVCEEGLSLLKRWGIPDCLSIFAGMSKLSDLSVYPFYLLSWTCLAAIVFQVALIDPRTDQYLFPAPLQTQLHVFMAPYVHIPNQNSQPVWVKKAIKNNISLALTLLNRIGGKKQFILQTFRKEMTKLLAAVITFGATFHSSNIVAPNEKCRRSECREHR